MFLRSDEEFRVSCRVSSFLHQAMVSCLISFVVLMEKSLILVTLSYKLFFSQETEQNLVRFNFVTELIDALRFL